MACLLVQGLTLTIPEMVPFRLTQNLVDAFGVSGYEGVFRRACEVTLQVSSAVWALSWMCLVVLAVISWAACTGPSIHCAALGPSRPQQPYCRCSHFPHLLKLHLHSDLVSL